MWTTDTLWFDISLITALTAFGQIFFGHFEERTPRLRRVFKILFFIAIAVTLTTTLGRAYTYGFLGIMALWVVIVHAIILPSKGINGWTAEPREKYYKLRGWEE